MKRGIFYTFLTQAPTLLLYFVSSTLMTRMLGDVGRGEYALLTNDSALFAMLLSLNLAFGVAYFTAKNPGDIRALVGVATSLVLFNGILVPFLLLGASEIGSFSNVFMPAGRTHWAYYGFLYLTVMSSLINGAMAAVLLGLKKFKVLNGMSILNASSNMIGFSALYLFREHLEPDEVLPAVLMVAGATMALQTIIWCAAYAIIVKIAPKPIWTWSIIAPVLAFSLVGHTSNLVNLINYRFDVWVVDHYWGTSQLGFYAVAVGIGQLLFYIPEPFTRVVQPYLFGQVKDEMLERYKVVSRLNFTSVLVISILLALVAQWLVPFLFGEVFANSVMALWLLLPGIVFSSGFKLLASLVINGNLQRYNLLATGVGALFTIVLGLLVIPLYGIAGAAIVTTISYFMTLLVVVLVIRFKLKIAVHDLFFLRFSDLVYFRELSSWKRTT